jgi:hypothetical protein
MDPSSALVDKLMTRRPCASARRVFWVVDNVAPHRGWMAAAGSGDALPNAEDDLPAGALILA